MRYEVSDWDDAYANGANIAGGERWPGLWVEPATAFRKRRTEAGRAELDISYGAAERNRLDLFLPDRDAQGLVVFIHGGFWLRLDKSFWSHLAAGPLAHGYAVAMPSYTLCPDIRISGIVTEIGAAIEKTASMVEGPIRLTGHSAGGHLATRMITATSPLPETVRNRIANTVSISGVHDLRPMMRTAMNGDLKIDAAEAMAESPALLMPMDGARVTCWVGGAERAEFRRQNALLANIWTGLGAATEAVEEPDRHHFDVIDGLADADHPLTRRLLTD
ncbi:alpha/beta fold hydrolase [Aliihoeflea aestuarii]|jgi:arylformamidase|uniref:alpha/beta hydrolase n=1 Tax=Aliihoeflea aestuarii TaxID=453840 RepID=UPI002093BF58|nr:alpha/beta hydrolase [Aliihoeflea aestuarii]MCO6391706.1 alpha/beta fold hydrolase [Aliihoeflea aestuarii]